MTTHEMRFGGRNTLGFILHSPRLLAAMGLPFVRRGRTWSAAHRRRVLLQLRTKATPTWSSHVGLQTPGVDFAVMSAIAVKLP